MIKVVIFDYDGLLIDSELIHYGVLKDKLAEQNEDFTLEQYMNLLGHSGNDCQVILGGMFPNVDFGIIFDSLYKELWERTVNTLPLKPGVRELFAYLYDHKIRITIASSNRKENILKIMEQAGLRDYVEEVTTSQEVKRGKPFPDIFLKATEKAGVSCNEAVVLEDSEAGIQSAYEAGIPVICIPDMKYPEEKYQKMTSAILPSLNEVINWIEERR